MTQYPPGPCTPDVVEDYQRRLRERFADLKVPGVVISTAAASFDAAHLIAICAQAHTVKGRLLGRNCYCLENGSSFDGGVRYLRLWLGGLLLARHRDTRVRQFQIAALFKLDP
jgi:hypothetical protein